MVTDFQFHVGLYFVPEKNLRSNIKDLLQRFKFKELISDVVLGIFELEPEEVKEKINELRLPSDKASVATLLSSRSQVGFDLSFLP